jgi:hypothetical protein
MDLLKWKIRCGEGREILGDGNEPIWSGEERG